jgi:tRNA(Ile)-lysidine synthase TilS/MesJ
MPPSAIDEPGKGHRMTKLAVPYCLDNEAVSLLTDILQGEAEQIFTECPAVRNDRLPVIAPFIAIAQDDIALYAEVQGFGPCGSRRNHETDPFREDVRMVLDAYTCRHPATKYSLMHLGESIRDAGTEAGVYPETGVAGESPDDNLRLPCKNLLRGDRI